MGRKKGKAKAGTWVTRDLLWSRALSSLSSTAKSMLLLFLSKRDMDHNHNVLNKRNITMTYKELENLFGKSFDGKPAGFSRGSIARGIKDLMAKGFIEIVHQGGAYQKDKTIYGLTDEWKWWVPGQVVRVKEPGKKAGYAALKNKSNHHNGTHTHHHKRNLK